MYKIITRIIISTMVAITSTYAQGDVANHNTKRMNDPLILLDNVAHDVNQDDRIQDNAFNDIDPLQGQYPSEYRITNAVDAIRIQISPYIQRTLYLGLSLAVIGVIYNGLRLVLKPTGINEGNIKKRLINIVTGVFILVGFYFIIQIIMGILSYLIG